MKICIIWKGSPMINIGNAEVFGWEAAIRGMRNPMNSWSKSDSFMTFQDSDPLIYTDPNVDISFAIGPNDQKLMKKLAKAGTDHRKFMRMIVVYADITAPLYWWKEFDTYKVGTVANSCSTMHKIAAKEFELDDFSHEHLFNEDDGEDDQTNYNPWLSEFWAVICMLNRARARFLETKNKRYWWQMIQLLPSSYNQKRTIMLNYEVLANMYGSRKDHKLDEWRAFCEWMGTLPYSELITGEDRKLEYADQPGLALGA